MYTKPTDSVAFVAVPLKSVLPALLVTLQLVAQPFEILQAALARQPSAGVESTYGLLCLYKKRFAESDDHFRRSQDLDPLGTTILINLALARYLEGRFRESKDEYRKIAARYPDMLGAQLQLAAFPMLEGRPELSLAEFKSWKSVLRSFH